MSDWVRSTRECTPDALPADIAAAIDEHLQLYELSINASQPLACIETVSKKSKAGLFDHGGATVVTAILLLPGWLLWAIRAENPQVTVMSARLADVTVQDYGATPFATMVADCGLEITGSFTGAGARRSSFIGLDDSPAAQRFKQRLIQAAGDARK